MQFFALYSVMTGPSTEPEIIALVSPPKSFNLRSPPHAPCLAPCLTYKEQHRGQHRGQDRGPGGGNLVVGTCVTPSLPPPLHCMVVGTLNCNILVGGNTEGKIGGETGSERQGARQGVRDRGRDRERDRGRMCRKACKMREQLVNLKHLWLSQPKQIVIESILNKWEKFEQLEAVRVSNVLK